MDDDHMAVSPKITSHTFSPLNMIGPMAPMAAEICLGVFMQPWKIFEYSPLEAAVTDKAPDKNKKPPA